MGFAAKNLVIDVAALVVFIIVSNPAWTGIGFHEWIGLGTFIVFVVHCAVHYDWIIDTGRSFMKKPSLAKRGNFVLDATILLMFMTVTVSGLGISGTVLPSIGLYSEGYYFWGPLHAISAKILLALLLVHIVVHWKWIVRVAKKENGNPKEPDERGGVHDEGVSATR